MSLKVNTVHPKHFVFQMVFNALIITLLFIL